MRLVGFLLFAFLLCTVSALYWRQADHPPAAMLGGFKEHKDHQNDARVQDVAKFAVKEVSEKSGEKLDLIKTVRAHTQVVAGTNYQLLLLVADSTNKEKYVEATVYEPLGGEAKQLSKHSFPSKGEVEAKREVLHEAKSERTVGSPTPVATDSPEVEEAAKFAVDTLGSSLNSLSPPSLKKVLQAHSAVSNGGVTYNLALQLSLGPAGDKVYNVAVEKGLQKHFKLVSATEQQQDQQQQQ